MTHFWILDVLTDLETFSSQNGLVDLADQISKCRDAAKEEISQTRMSDQAPKTCTGG